MSYFRMAALLIFVNIKDVIIEIQSTIINKYNVPAPKYMSYPTVPFWIVKNYLTVSGSQVLKRSLMQRMKSKGLAYISTCHFVEFHVPIAVVIHG